MEFVAKKLCRWTAEDLARIERLMLHYGTGHAMAAIRNALRDADALAQASNGSPKRILKKSRKTT